MQDELSLFGLIADATLVAQAIMLILLLLSLISWTFIFGKWRELKAARAQADAFEARFWSGAELNELYRELADQDDAERSGLAGIFCAGFGEYARGHEEGAATGRVSETAVREMQVALSRETDYLDSRLNFLATVGSTSPYIGLLGTVWGIMDAFLALHNVRQATLSLVAPGIAEALIATAMGLIAAIPAVIAYNRFRDRADRLIVRYGNFIDEFTSVLARQNFRRGDGQ